MAASTPTHGPYQRDLGTGWKVRPSRGRPGPGRDAGAGGYRRTRGDPSKSAMTPTGNYRYTILRFYWDGEDTPLVEVPIGDFFASAFTNYNTFRPIASLPVCVNPGNAFNCSGRCRSVVTARSPWKISASKG